MQRLSMKDSLWRMVFEVLLSQSGYSGLCLQFSDVLLHSVECAGTRSWKEVRLENHSL